MGLGETLTRALQLHQPEMKIMIKISKSVLDEDRLEDLRGFWTALWPAATWCVSSHISCLGMVLHNEDSPLLEDSLRLELEEIMDMSHDEWDGLNQSILESYVAEGDNEEGGLVVFLGRKVKVKKKESEVNWKKKGRKNCFVVKKD